MDGKRAEQMMREFLDSHAAIGLKTEVESLEFQRYSAAYWQLFEALRRS